MLEEIIPALQSQKGTKVLSAKPKITERLPEIDSKISFVPFINYLKEKQAVTTDIHSDIYKYLIRRFEEEPALLQPIEEIDLLKDQGELLKLLTTVLFPLISEPQKNNFTLAVPYQFSVFQYSDPFHKLFIDEEHLLMPADIPEGELKEIHCAMIYDHVLEKFYGVKLNDPAEMIFPVCNADTGLKQYYKMRYDRRFIDIKLKGALPPLKDCAVCLNTFRILDLQKQLEKMPLDLFSAEGFAVWVAEDVTADESLEIIKKILLRHDDCDTIILRELKPAIQVLVGLNDIKVGLMPFIKLNNRFVLEDACTGHSILSKNWRAGDQESQSTFEMYMNFIAERPGPVPISILNEEMVQQAPFLKPLLAEGIRSYIHYPLQNSDGILGILEVASPVPNQLNFEVMSRLEPAIPLLSLALLKTRENFNNRVEKLIKEKFTALQPSVEWKFAEAAWEHLRSSENESAILSCNVAFDNVYPLYGAVDIRNSSVERNSALQKDLKEHLLLVDHLLDQLQTLVQLPLLEGLKFKNQNIQLSIRDTIVPEDEVRIHEFLENEVEPVFLHLQKSNRQAQELVDHYFNIVHDTNGQLYHFHREYEETLAIINKAVLDYLEKEEDTVQKSYPHYFEKYRTDGVEYNIYIGQSIAPDHPFDLLYLKNLRLWQIKSMAEVARINHTLLPSLKVPLQTTQLILIHSQPIAISFRRDERRFDVEGSYNIRYETMKKRIDKVRIKDTEERLTQIGKIAIVYSNMKEAQEYVQYIEFLQNKNILRPGIEWLELEELQGVKGLKALRVDVNLEGS
ncbi:MAG TPA: hypothetical protein VH396_21900 [Chitinophagaceae bacterium]|jgi:hypothetical protein